MTQVNLATLSNQNLVSELLTQAWRDDSNASVIEDEARWKVCRALYQEICKRLEKQT